MMRFFSFRRRRIFASLAAQQRLDPTYARICARGLRKKRRPRGLHCTTVFYYYFSRDSYSRISVWIAQLRKKNGSTRLL